MGRSGIDRNQQFSQLPTSAVQQHSDGVGRQFEPLPHLAIGQPVQTNQTKYFGLLPRQFGQGDSQPFAQFVGFGPLFRPGLRTDQAIHVGRRIDAIPPPIASAQQIQSTRRGQMPKHRRPIADRLLASHTDRFQEHILKTIRGVGMVADQSIGRAPYEPAVLVERLFSNPPFADACKKPRFRRVVAGKNLFITEDSCGMQRRLCSTRADGFHGATN